MRFWVFIFLILSGLASANVIIEHGGTQVFIPNKVDNVSKTCVDTSGETGKLKSHVVKTSFPGRWTIGDVDNDGQPDIVVTQEKRMAAYSVCGGKLWDLPVNTNWVYKNHVFWNWTSYGWVGDADGDGEAEFLHIGADWRTLYVRNGLTGKTEKTIDLGSGRWMYVLLGRRIEDTGKETTRVYVTGRPGDHRIKSYDIRNGTKLDWSFNGGSIINAYLPPQVVNLNKSGGDEIVHGSYAVDSQGRRIWKHTAQGLSVLNAFHTMQCKDIDPDKAGLECTYSTYAPPSGKPAIVNIALSNPGRFNWAAGRGHGHQHVVGDFVPSKPGLETLVRYGDGKKHYLIDSKGRIISNYERMSERYFPRHWNSGEMVNGIEWDDQPGTEILMIERHVRFREIPKLIITTGEKVKVATGNKVVIKTWWFHGGKHVPKTDKNPTLADRPTTGASWWGLVDRNRPGLQDEGIYNNDGPYEGNAHPVDMFGDGREEVVAPYDGGFRIYYNSGNAGVPKRWGNHDYESQKQIWTNVYNPR